MTVCMPAICRDKRATNGPAASFLPPLVCISVSLSLMHSLSLSLYSLSLSLYYLFLSLSTYLSLVATHSSTVTQISSINIQRRRVNPDQIRAETSVGVGGTQPSAAALQINTRSYEESERISPPFARYHD
jgi:nanoRNase/pAp phosphatase (c-di-AMP/oligoRNAs hydrolase)